MRHQQFQWAARATAAMALCTGLAAGPAHAAVMKAEQLNVYRNGSSVDWLQGASRLLGDGFDNGDPLSGPAFSSTGLPASYVLLGAASPGVVAQAAREENGQLVLDPNFGAVSSNALGQSGTSLRLRLLTNISDVGGGLNVSRTFATTLRLSLASAPDPGQSFGLRLTDGGISAINNDVIELSWAGGAGAGNIVFRKQDFGLGTITPLGSAAVSAPAGAAMLVLSMAHNEADTPWITGSYNYADSNGQLLGAFTGFGNAAVAFQGEAYTRLELRAVGLSAPIPEPGTWALMAVGLGVLLRRRSQAAG